MSILKAEIIPFLSWHTNECPLSICDGCGNIVFSEHFALHIDLYVNEVLVKESNTGIVLCRYCYDLFASKR
jgi:hypothetical protein